MNKFRQWLESKNEITYLSKDNYGNITFAIRNKRYTYNVDTALYQQPDFQRALKYQPGTALNIVKTNGILVKKPSKPKFNTDICPNCGANKETYQNGIVPCPNCGHSID